MNIKSIFECIKSAFSVVSPYIVKALKWVVSDFRHVIIVILAILAIIFFWKYKNAEKDYETAIANAKTEITTYKNKAGELYACTQAQVTDISTLKKQNSDLYNEVKNLKDDPLVVTKINAVTKIDTIRIESIVIKEKDSTYSNDIKYADDWCSINGKNTMNLKTFKSITTFDSISFKNDMTLDIIEKNDNLYAITKCSSPYTTINTIETAVISPENSKILKKKFNKPWGIMVGLGMSGSVVDKKMRLIPAAHITFGYKLFSF